ncbi:MAG TPA: transposase [Burkholderiales bacterium]|nr:transposase [Burkholderiales bacterium]
MARLPRLTVPGYPHHLIQRGNNRQAVFADSTDYRRMLEYLGECAPRYGVAIHAYVLMSNHFHLLATPDDEHGLSSMMQSLGRRYVRSFNDRHNRTGTLWEGRFKATVIDSERYLIACMAYVELNPVRAGMVLHPADYPWSSYAHQTGIQHDPLITPHSLYWALGNTPFSREAAYRQVVESGLGREQIEDFTQATLKGWALGGPDFVAALQEQTGRRTSRQKAGRPYSKL